MDQLRNELAQQEVADKEIIDSDDHFIGKWLSVDE